MPLEARKFIFTVSLCAMLAANPVLATAPTNDEDLDTAHDVYVESTLNQATNGIAGVSYVNRMVNAAGNAADAAEAHAAAAGAHALSAAQSADEAHKVLADKVNIDQGEDYKYLAMVTDQEGTVYPGYITSDMIEKHSVSTSEIQGPDESVDVGADWVLMGSGKSMTYWAKVGSSSLKDGAVTTDKIDNGAVTSGKIADYAVTSDKIVGGAVSEDKISSLLPSGGAYQTGVLVVDGNGGAEWGQVGSADIANYAVTSDKIADDAVTVDKIKKGEDVTVLLVQSTGTAAHTAWGKIDSEYISDGAVTTDKIAKGAVTADKLDLRHGVKAGMPLVFEWKNNTTGMTYGAGTILPSGIVPADESGMALVSQKHVDSSGRASIVTEWGQVSSVGIANGAVTIEKTAGVVGMVPVGGEGANTYGSLWIE